MVITQSSFFDDKNLVELKADISINNKYLTIDFVDKNQPSLIWYFSDIEFSSSPIKKEGTLFLNNKHPNAQLFIINCPAWSGFVMPTIMFTSN